MYTATTLALQRLRQEDYQFEYNLGYLVRPCLKDEEKVR